MTTNTRAKTLARRYQAATGLPYATALTHVREWEESESSARGWDETAFQVTHFELHDLVKKAAATLPEGSVTVMYDPYGNHPGAVPLTIVTIAGEDEGVSIEIDAQDGYPGYTRHDEDDEVLSAANFFDANGKEITATGMLTTYAADLACIAEGLEWLLHSLVEDPHGYDEPGLPWWRSRSPKTGPV